MTDQAASNQSSFGAGQQNPSSSASDFNSTAFLIRQMMARMETMKLVKVVAVKAGEGDPPTAGTVDVQPLVSQVDGSGNSTPHGTVYGIPWSRVQGGKNAVICDPQVDDIGYVVASDRDISAVKTAKKVSNPGSLRRFSISDGIYAGGALNVAPEQYLIFTDTGWRLVDKHGNSIVSGEDGFVLTDKSGNVISTKVTGIDLTPKSGTAVTVNGKLIVTENLVAQQNLQIQGSIQNQSGGTYAGDLETAGNVIAGAGSGSQVGLQTHTHNQPNDSHGDTEQPTNAPNPGT